MRYFMITAMLLSAGCNRVTDGPRKIRIDTPDGEVVAMETTVKATPQTITIVIGDDLARLRSLGEDGPQFVSHYIHGVTHPGLNDYDAAFAAWQQDSSPPYTSEQIVQILGGYLGNKCVTDFEMEWVMVTDEYGTDYAVRSTKFKMMSFPFSSVQERIDDKKLDFVYAVYYVIKETLTNGDAKVREQNQSKD